MRRTTCTLVSRSRGRFIRLRVNHGLLRGASPRRQSSQLFRVVSRLGRKLRLIFSRARLGRVTQLGLVTTRGTGKKVTCDATDGCLAAKERYLRTSD